MNDPKPPDTSAVPPQAMGHVSFEWRPGLGALAALAERTDALGAVGALLEDRRERGQLSRAHIARLAVALLGHRLAGPLTPRARADRHAPDLVGACELCGGEMVVAAEPGLPRGLVDVRCLDARKAAP